MTVYTTCHRNFLLRRAISYTYLNVVGRAFVLREEVLGYIPFGMGLLEDVGSGLM